MNVGTCCKMCRNEFRELKKLCLENKSLNETIVQQNENLKQDLRLLRSKKVEAMKLENSNLPGFPIKDHKDLETVELLLVKPEEKQCLVSHYFC